MRKKRFITLGLIVAAFGVAGIVAFMKYQDECELCKRVPLNHILG